LGWRRRQPDPALPSGAGESAERAGREFRSIDDPPQKNHHAANRPRLTAQDLETQRIEREQAAIAEGAKRAEQAEREMRAAWERERGAWCAARGIPRDGSVDRSRYVY
jgi:hypothetical protein